MAIDEATSVGVVDVIDSAASDPVADGSTAFSVGGSMIGAPDSTAS